ncbi:Ribonuclease kappa [Mizuhopecten yessoensis]|uniref:Ribonuclease kappa n=1 Tax=Mizuhopecten yessoensis TaxID=6573 RepID=A0A210QT60_MIZYE|nr:Ribonuclease kappa [Mizuhopecten yessoensis]
MSSCPICGPKLSVCCTVVSIWGIIMLALLGVFFQIHSPALFEDIPVDEIEWKRLNYSMEYVHEKYEQTALNCFIAAGIYILFFFFSCCQQRMHARASYELS